MKSKLIKVLYSTRSRGGSSYFHGSSYIETPKIQMEGKWLETLGFHIGDRLQVDYEEGAIHIRLAPEPEPQPAIVCESPADYRSKCRKGKRKQ